MKALVCTEFGSLEQLAIKNLPSLLPGPGQVLIDVKASAINFPDALIVQGLYQVKPPRPFSPGSELSGVVKEIGEGVKDFAVGDRVIALPGSGGFAEECLAPVEKVMLLPPDLDFDIGAAFSLTYGTSLHALKDCGQLKSGETLLVLGAAGGVGSAAVEIGKVLGAYVIAAASSDEKLALCKQVGADATINYSREDMRKRLRDLTGGQGVDMVYDPVGGNYSETALRATGWRGRFLVIGFAAGEIPNIPLNLALLKERSVIGVYWGNWIQHDPIGYQNNVKQLMELLVTGKIRPVISERVPLAEASAAMERMMQRQAKGKIVVLPEA